MVIDTSALLSLFFAETNGEWVAKQMNGSAVLKMSTVNLAETLIRLRDRQPTLYPTLEQRVLEGGIQFIPPTVEHARIAADARLRFPLNMGDCFAFALAFVERLPLLTLDVDFRKTGISLVAPFAG